MQEFRLPFESSRSSGNFDVTLCDFDSAPLASSYGVAGQPLKSILGFYVDLDLELTTVDEVPI